MTDWQRTFLKKFEQAKKHWLLKFEEFANEVVEPTVRALEEFTTAHGFHVARPPCDPGHRIFKFGLTENGYVLVSVRMRGLEEVEVRAEVFVPGLGGRESSAYHTLLCDADQAWVENRFQECLDVFITLFGEAGAGTVRAAQDLVSV